MQCDALQPVRSPVSARSREYSDFKPDYSDQHRRLRVEGYVEGYVLNVGLEGNSQNRQEAGFSFQVLAACLHASLALTRCLHEAQTQKSQPLRIGLSA